MGFFAAIAILIIYGVTASLAIKRITPNILSKMIVFGFMAGLIFAIEIILEYILLPNDNSMYGLLEFGGVFLIYFLASLLTAYQTRSIRDGVISALGTAMIATLIWSIVTLSMYYLFRGSPQQTQVFQAEGNYADFAQSGMTDFNTFIIEDFMGAVFFHSLLGPFLAMILGTVGGALGKGIAKLRSH